MNKGKAWSKPQLILLAKGTADECVLTTCKSTTSGSGATATNSACYCHTACSGAS